VSRFDHRRVLITGASSGIGQALAAEFVRQGAAVVLLARRGDRLRQQASERRAAGATVIPVAGDVTLAESRAAALDAAEQQLGGLDILVNNAGCGAWGDFDTASPDVMRQIFEVNFFAATELTQAALPLLRAGIEPAIINIGSILAYRAVPGASQYCASKFALRGWSESLRAELRAHGVHVLLVTAGTTETGFVDALLERKSEMPWRRAGVTPEHVARATVRALARRKSEVIPSGSARLLYWVNRLAPWAVEAYLSRVARGPLM
jgi:short-subunit dehydrogenase